MKQKLYKNFKKHEATNYLFAFPKRSRLKEPFISTIVLFVIVFYSMWPLLIAPHTVFPVTTDAMGHLTKINYVADCLKNFTWPSWFPYWYNGSTVMQYYPPLAYLLLAPVQMMFKNAMITFKFYGFFSLFIGALGIWYTCYRYIGPWVGILGGIFYALQPFLWRYLLFGGVMAQGPIYAFSPWFLYFTVVLLEQRTFLAWLAVCIISSLMILSHAMHAFLTSLCLGIVATVLVIQRKAEILVFFLGY